MFPFDKEYFPALARRDRKKGGRERNDCRFQEAPPVLILPRGEMEGGGDHFWGDRRVWGEGGRDRPRIGKKELITQKKERGCRKCELKL